MSNYQIKKALNNNIVLCLDRESEQECIIMGKGIGFQAVGGEVVDEKNIERVYFRKKDKEMNQYLSLLSRCDEKVVAVVEEIITLMEKEFGTMYDDYIHIALLDHLNFSLYRINHNIKINNIFLEEYSLLYEKEYRFAKIALDKINHTLGVQLPDVEVGFIAMHIHAALTNEKASKTNMYMQVIAEAIDFIEKDIKKKIPVQSLQRMRLITHLKFALERAEKKIALQNLILDSLRSNYPETYQLSEKLAKMIFEKFNIQLEEGEIGYLTLHIQNIVVQLQEVKE